jgi:thioester reductase-like protein
MKTLLDYLRHWVSVQPDTCFSTFLDLSGSEREAHTYSSFDLRSTFLAERLREETSIARGDRVLLVYSPGLEMIAALVACIRIGAIPVPIPPPGSFNAGASSTLLQTVSSDCGAAVVLTDGKTDTILNASPRARPGVIRPDCPADSRELEWIVTDDLSGTPSSELPEVANDVLLLQYTSGSTGDPKGVIVSHMNVIENCHAIIDHQPIGVSWLPQFHDMGLIAYYLFLIVTGGTTYGFSPFDFLRRPALWLETLSRYQATLSSAPNFGFEYCLSEERVPEEQLTHIDLSSVRVLMSGSEPVRPSTYRRFLQRFTPYGLRPEAHVAAYGLAENTLAVSTNGRRQLPIDRRSLHRHEVKVLSRDTTAAHRVDVMSCGRPVDGVHVRIVDPETRAAVGQREVGEIWVAGRSRCLGYWNRPELTAEIFENSLADDPSDERPYLRTGDLGFIDSEEIFVCGRLKDVVIFRGRNYYAEDLERAIEQACSRGHTRGVVVFQSEEGSGHLVVMVGARRPSQLPDPVAISRSLYAQGFTGPHVIVFVRPAMIARTTSGKPARGRMRASWAAGSISALATHLVGFDDGSGDRTPSSGLSAVYEQLLSDHSLTGDEARTLSDAGFDSLAIVSLLSELERVAEDRGVPSLGQTLDGPLLQRLSVSDLTELITTLVREDGRRAPDLPFSIGRIKQELESRDRAAMRRDSQLGVIGSGELPHAAPSVENVLLTGGTGFLGPFLLRSLLSHSDAVYHVLVRAAHESAARSRLYECFRQAGLSGRSAAHALETRVRVVCGNLAEPNLGLSPSSWSSLARTVDAVVHNGAVVDYLLGYESLRAANVAGTRELLRLATTSRRKQFHLVSSTIIFGWSARGELRESEANEDMKDLDFGYAQTKWVSEQLALAALKRGLHVRIYRPSFLTPSTLGFGNAGDVVVRLMAFMINHGVAPKALNQLSFMPVDVAAHNMAMVMMTANVRGHAFHITVDQFYDIVDVTHMISREYGIRFRYVSAKRFSAEMRKRCTEDDLAYPLLDFIERSHRKIVRMQEKRYSNTRFRAALAQSGRGRPDPSLRKTVSYLMAYMLNEGLIRSESIGGTRWSSVCRGSKCHQATREAD